MTLQKRKSGARFPFYLNERDVRTSFTLSLKTRGSGGFSTGLTASVLYCCLVCVHYQEDGNSNKQERGREIGSVGEICKVHVEWRWASARRVERIVRYLER